MAFVLITFTAALVLDLAVLTLLKIGLRNSSSEGEAAGDWAGRQPC